MTQYREAAADFWDDALAGWISEEPLAGELQVWRASYTGTGAGAVDDTCYPDPYVGDLRGLEDDPVVVVLGLNPGIGYQSLQGRDGLWTERIASEGYSYCRRRSPAEDPEVWKQHHGGPSVYWRNLITFTSRWVGGKSTVADVLNVELYPWHSKKVTGPMTPPLDLLDTYVWKPLQEIPGSDIFAFGTKWFDICEQLQLKRVQMWGAGAPVLAAGKVASWRVGVFELPTGQLVVVSAQAGYAGPPNKLRTEILRSLVDGS